MSDLQNNEILELGRALGRHPGRLVLPEEGTVASRVTDTRLAMSRRGASLAELAADDLLHFDLQRLGEVIAQEPVLPEDLTGAQLHAAHGVEIHDDLTTLACLMTMDPAIKVATHIHPVLVDQITSSPRARQFADRRITHNEVLSLGSAALLVNYADPGIGLTREIQKKMILWRDRYKSVPRIVFVQNHGVILTGTSNAGLLASIDALLKYAELFTGASALGGPVFLTPQAITAIEQQNHSRGAA